MTILKIEKEYNELCVKVSKMTYEEAFKKLNSYNLTAEAVTCNKELICISESFQVTYKHISTTIFRTKNNGCEVWEEFDAHMVMNCEGDVELA